MNFKSRNFCILPWTHIYFFTDGYAYPCPKLAGNKKFRLGSNNDNLSELWNSDVLKTMRLKMLRDEAIKECDMHCNNNITSCKKFVGNDLLDCSMQFIQSTNTDGSVDNINFIGANVIENNKCNFKCQYCCKDYSNLHSTSKQIQNTFNNQNAIFENLSNLKEIWLAGGEPVIEEKTYELLDCLIKNNQTNIRLRVITNLSNIEYKGKKFYELLRLFSDCIVFGSWDMDGKIGEYIRKNSNSNIILNNIRYIKSLGIKLCLQPVISIFNIMHIYKFHKRLYNLELIGKQDMRYYTLTSPKIYRISILPKNVKVKVTEDLYNYVNWLNSDKITDFYANLEHPGTFVKKIINLMNTGKGGHEDNGDCSQLFNEFLKFTYSQDIKTYGYFKFSNLYKEYKLDEYI